MSYLLKTKCKILISKARQVHISCFGKNNFVKAVYFLNISQHTKFHSPTLTGSSFAFTSEV
jgi:hypothetical protein